MRSLQRQGRFNAKTPGLTGTNQGVGSRVRFLALELWVKGLIAAISVGAAVTVISWCVYHEYDTDQPAFFAKAAPNSPSLAHSFN